MSGIYAPQTWTARVGTFLNRFTKSNETPTSVDLTNAPASVSVAGDPFSSARMLHMETGIFNAYNYDLIIDSNAALNLWVNNTTGAYPRVLVRRGTWTSSVTAPTGGIFLNLDAGGPGTVLIVGEPGAEIVFGVNSGSTVYGLYHATAGAVEDIRGLKVTLTNTGAGSARAFYRCTTPVYCTTSVTNSGNGLAHGFYECLAPRDSSATSSSNGGGGTASGFYSCTKPVNCSGTVTTTSVSVAAYAFYNCSSPVSCTGIGTGPFSGDGFFACTNCVGCVGTGNGTTTGTASGFNQCLGVLNCSGTGNGGSTSGPGYGFNACIGVGFSKGVGLAAGSGVGYGFFACKKAGQNAALSASKTATYNTTYADASTTNAAADTAAGGYNS